MEKHPWLAYKNWAVVGASTDPDRYGNKIVHSLKKHDFNVLPVAPKYKDIDGIKAYSSILDIEEPVDVVNFVVNPNIGMKVLDECIQKGIKRIWLQPGTVSQELIEKAKAAQVEVIQACILVVLSW